MHFIFSKNLFFHLLLLLIFSVESSILLASEEKEVLGILEKYKKVHVKNGGITGLVPDEQDRKLLSKFKESVDWGAKNHGDYEIDHIDVKILFIDLKFIGINPPLYSIKILNLAGNNLCDNGTMLLFENMNSLPNLVTLNIAGNKITDASVQTIASFLKSNPPLTHLNLANNKIKNILSLAKVLGNPGNTCLKTLGLNNLHLETTSTKELAKSFPANMTLQSFIWDQSETVIWDKSHPAPIGWHKKGGKDANTSIISQANLDKIIKYLKENKREDKSLRRLSISDLIVVENNIDSKGFDKIECNFSDELKISIHGLEFYKPSHVGVPLDYERSIMAIDPSGAGPDESAYAVVRKLRDNFYVTAVGGLEGDGSQTAVLERLIKIALINKVGLILVEKNYYHGLYENFLKYILEIQGNSNIQVISIQSDGIKEKRIMDILYPILIKHRLIISSGVINDDLNPNMTVGSYSLINQLRSISYQAIGGEHDDRLDALSMAVDHLSQ